MVRGHYFCFSRTCSTVWDTQCFRSATTGLSTPALFAGAGRPSHCSAHSHNTPSRGCDVLIATPGRLTDMFEPGHPDGAHRLMLAVGLERLDASLLCIEKGTWTPLDQAFARDAFELHVSTFVCSMHLPCYIAFRVLTSKRHFASKGAACDSSADACQAHL